MRIYTFHPSGVIDTSERIGSLMRHEIVGPPVEVVAYVTRMDAIYPSLHVLSSVYHRDTLEIVVQRDIEPAHSGPGGMTVAYAAPARQQIDVVH